MTMPTIKQRPRRVHMPTRSIPLVEDPAPRPEKVVFHLDAVNVHYGAFHAVRDVSLDIREHEITAFIGPSRLRQVHRAALPQPHERPHHGRPGRGHGRLPRRRPLRPEHRPGRGPPPDRHGVPEAQPVPQVDLRQRRLRAAARRGARADDWRDRGGGLRQAALWDEVKDRLKESGLRALRWPAAAAVHRPGDRRGARR